MTVEELKAMAKARNPDGSFAVSSRALVEMLCEDMALLAWINQEIAALLSEDEKGDDDGENNRNIN